MDSPTGRLPTSSSSNPDGFELDIPTSESDIAFFRARRTRSDGFTLERINDLSATMQFPNLVQRRTTSAGFEPFTIVEE